MGDHAAVYGRPAVLATLDLQTRAVVSSAEADGVIAELPDFGRSWQWSADEISDLTDLTRGRWQEYRADPSAERYASLIGSGDAERLAMLAIGEAAQAVGHSADGIGLRVASALPAGAGLGSSASVAAAIVGALLAFWDRHAGVEQVADIVREVERRQHGLPSGVDHQTVIRGGVVWAEPGAEAGSAELSDLACSDAPQPIVIDTGPRQQTTGEVVEVVRGRAAGDPTIWNEMHEATREFRAALESSGDVRPMVRRYHRCLQRLGVVPARVAEWIGSWEDDGGAAKISGAGATRGDRAGCLLVYPPAKGAPADLPLPDGWMHIETAIGGPGLRIGIE